MYEKPYTKSATKLSLSGLASYEDSCYWCESPHHDTENCELYKDWITACNPNLTKEEINELVKPGMEDNSWDYVFDKPDGEYLTKSGEVRVIVKDKRIRNLVPAKYQNKNIPYASIPSPDDMIKVQKLSDFKTGYYDEFLYQDSNVIEPLGRRVVKEIERLRTKEKEYLQLTEVITADAVTKLLDEMRLLEQDVTDMINPLMWNPRWKDVPNMIEDTPRWVLMKAHLNSIAAHNAIVLPIRSRGLKGGWMEKKNYGSYNAVMLRYVITSIIGSVAVDVLDSNEKHDFDEFVDTLVNHCRNHRFSNSQVFDYLSRMVYLHNCRGGGFAVPSMYKKEVAALVSSFTKMFSNRDVTEVLCYHLPDMSPVMTERLVKWTAKLITQECRCDYHADWPFTGPLPYTAQSMPPLDYIETTIKRTDPRVSSSDAYFLAIETVVMNILMRAHYLYNPYGPCNILEEHQRARANHGRFTRNEVAYFRQKLLCENDDPMEIIEEKLSQLLWEKMATCPCKTHGMIRSIKDYGYEWQPCSSKLKMFSFDRGMSEYSKTLSVSSYPESDTDYEVEYAPSAYEPEDNDHWSLDPESDHDVPDLQFTEDPQTVDDMVIPPLTTLKDAVRAVHDEINEAMAKSKRMVGTDKQMDETDMADTEQEVPNNSKEEAKEEGEIDISSI